MHRIKKVQSHFSWIISSLTFDTIFRCWNGGVTLAPDSHCAILSATEHRVPGKWKLTSDPVNLAPWNHFYLLLCIHLSQNQWITSRFLPALLAVNARFKMASDLVIFVTAAATTLYWKHRWWEYLQFLLKVSKYFFHRWPLWWPYLWHATEDIQVWMYFL